MANPLPASCVLPQDTLDWINHQHEIYTKEQLLIRVNHYDRWPSAGFRTIWLQDVTFHENMNDLGIYVAYRGKYYLRRGSLGGKFSLLLPY